MLILKEARDIAGDYLKSIPVMGDVGRLVIIENATIEKSYAWIFFYNSEHYMKSGDIMHALGGNAPLFISKHDGQVSIFPTNLSIEEMIERYEKG